jgi:hypothetical protein
MTKVVRWAELPHDFWGWGNSAQGILTPFSGITNRARDMLLSPNYSIFSGEQRLFRRFFPILHNNQEQNGGAPKKKKL